MKYILLPFAAWIVSGSLKFLVNFSKHGLLSAKKLIGYGGLPSTHTTIISSVVFLNGFS
ncbi:MAG: divergent PAP2 family protein [Selenomonadaceae bacterium]|nr:divergent PAP2 family protein [Selenomonadaceae bacterium]